MSWAVSHPLLSLSFLFLISLVITVPISMFAPPIRPAESFFLGVPFGSNALISSSGRRGTPDGEMR